MWGGIFSWFYVYIFTWILIAENFLINQRKIPYLGLLIEAEWSIYASVKYTIIGSDNGSAQSFPLFTAKPLSEPMLAYYKWDPLGIFQ